MIETKQKILNTAERLIGDQGYSGTSLRQIIGEAGVNLAAVHYHFGSKEELLDELIVRKAGPVNEARLAWLDRLESAPDGRQPTSEEVLEAFFLPMADAADQAPEFVKLMGRVLAEGLMQQLMERHFQTVSRRFFGALRRAVPEIPEDEFQWRTHFMIGAMAHTMCGPPDLTGMGSIGSFRERIERLIAFIDGGFHAPIRSESDRKR